MARRSLSGLAGALQLVGSLVTLVGLAACGGTTVCEGDACASASPEPTEPIDPPAPTPTPPAPGACVTPQGAGDFAIGTGEECFEPLGDAHVVPLVAGPQGGYHVWISLGCRDCAGAAAVRYGTKDASGAWVASDGPLMFALQEGLPTVDQWGSLAGIQGYMPGLSWDPEAEPAPQKGDTFTVYVAVVDADLAPLHEAEVEITIGDTVYWDPCEDDPEQCFG